MSEDLYEVRLDGIPYATNIINKIGYLFAVLNIKEN